MPLLALLPILIPLIEGLIEGTPAMIKSGQAAFAALKKHPDYADPAVKAQVDALEQRLIAKAAAVGAYQPRPA
jgi:predicted PurR-regulated permease PerM